MQQRTFFLAGLAVILTIFGVGLVLQQPAFLATPAPVAASNAPSTSGVDLAGAAANPDLAGRAAAAAADRCGPGLVYLADAGICTHGADPAPPGVDPDRPVETLGLRTANRRAAAMSCDGDGTTGPRIQIIYLRGTSAPDRYHNVLPSIRAFAADADQIVQDSAAATGGYRQIRFVHDANCAPTVLNVAVPDSQLSSFNRSVNALTASGYQRQDRIYLIFADTTAAGICGVATIWNDDRPGQQNWNNSGPGYARVDAGCWNGTVVAHELVHTFGGVQLSAPNTTGGFHCTDENDILCYADSYGSPPMRTVCREAFFHERLDCNNDDYFHTAPAAGSYLSNHWNAANSRFLIKGPDDRTGSIPFDATPPRVNLVVPKAVQAGKRVRVAANVSDPVGVSRVEFRICPGKRCTWTSAKRLSATTTRPYRTTLKAPKRGSFTVIVRAVDRAGNVKVTKKTVKVKPAKQNKKGKGKARR